VQVVSVRLQGVVMTIRTPAELGTLIRNTRQKLKPNQASLSKKIGVSRLWLNENRTRKTARRNRVGAANASRAEYNLDCYQSGKTERVPK
jgi:hypothetical protein